MSVTVNRKELLESLNKVRGAVPTTDVIPVLTHFMVEDGEITATDLDIGIVTACPLLKGLDFLVPATKLHNLIRNLKQDELELELSEGGEKLTIKAPGHKSSILVMPRGEDFPSIKKQFRRWLPVPDDFSAAVKACSCTMDESRGFVFGCILWGEHGMVSSDTLQISWHTLGKQFPKEAILLNGRLVQELIRLGQPNGWAIHEHVIAFDYEETQLVGTLVDGRFPERWVNLFPTERPSRMLDLGKDVQDSLRRVTQFAAEEDEVSKLSLDSEGLAVQLSDTDGEIEERIEAFSEDSWECLIPSGSVARILKYCSKGCLVEASGRQMLYLENENGNLKVAVGTAKKGVE